MEFQMSERYDSIHEQSRTTVSGIVSWQILQNKSSSALEPVASRHGETFKIGLCRFQTPFPLRGMPANDNSLMRWTSTRPEQSLPNQPQRTEVRFGWFGCACSVQANCIVCVLLQLSIEFSFAVVNPGTGFSLSTQPWVISDCRFYCLTEQVNFGLEIS